MGKKKRITTHERGMNIQTAKKITQRDNVGIATSRGRISKNAQNHLDKNGISYKEYLEINLEIEKEKEREKEKE